MSKIISLLGNPTQKISIYNDEFNAITLALMLTKGDANVALNSHAIDLIAANPAACSMVKNSTLAISTLLGTGAITVPVLTSNTGTNCVVSGLLGSNNIPAWNAFDGNDSTQWDGGAATPGGWLQVTFNFPVWCYQFMQKTTAGSTIQPVTVKIQYSYDNVNWYDATGGLACGGVSTTKIYPVAYPCGRTRYWRWWVVTGSAYYNSLATLQFYCK